MISAMTAPITEAAQEFLGKRSHTQNGISSVFERRDFPASAPQRVEVRRPVVAGDHGLVVDQE